MTLDAPNDYHLHMIPRRGKRGERRNVEDSSDLHGCCLLWRYSNGRDVSFNEVEGGGIRNEGDNALAIHDWWQWCEGRIEQENGVSGGLKIRQVARKGFLEDEGVGT
jgi:hypothetical protein